MPKPTAEKVLIRLDWRRERAYRVGLVLARLGLVLSFAASLINYAFSEMIVVYSDILSFFGCLGTLFFTYKKATRTLVWWPFYSSYWIAATTTLYASGGIKSPFIGILMALLFVGGVVVQSSLKAITVLWFVFLNFLFWLVADFYLPITGPYSQPPIYCFLINAICTGAIGICIYGFIKTEQDLAEEFTARYRELETAKNNLSREEIANAAKSSFLANISHEFRTPLGVILGYVEVLQSLKKNDAESLEYLGIVHRNGHQLAHLVDDLLDLSKAEADRLEIEKRPFNLHEVLKQVRDSLKLTAEKKELQLRFEFVKPIPSIVTSDAARLKQILLNLIGNAIKFTEKGGVSVAVDFSTANATNLGHLKICIIDTGRGLSQAEKEKLFKPFSQADASMARKYGGTGLGLNLSKRLAELLGGDIILSESAPGQGSRFTLSIEVETAANVELIEHFDSVSQVKSVAESKHDSRDKFRLEGFNFLVVDDLPDNRILVQRYIQGAGGKVDFAKDGHEGIEKALAGNYDLILMDIQMPGLSGLDATALLREKQYHRPIVALSAHAMLQDRDRSLEAGCNEHLTKPIQKDSFLDRIESILQG